MPQIDVQKGTFPIIIKPNLGQPIIINLKDYKDEKGAFIRKITFEALIITIPNQDVKTTLEYFISIHVQPILKDEGQFQKRRGQLYEIKPIELKKIDTINLESELELDERNCVIWDIFKGCLQIDEIFGKRTEIHRLIFEIKDIGLIEDLLKTTNKNVLLFDIVHKIPNIREEKINFHSIAVFDKEWKDFKFIHATDFHVARRNDFIEKFLRDKAKDKLLRFQKRKKEFPEKDIYILHREFEYLEDFQNTRLDDLRVAKYNFNHNLRLLIETINEEVIENNLDFVLMTGDLIDYWQIARGTFDYENNFQVFIDIMLGINRGLEREPYFKESEHLYNRKEILAPIFTIVGNHDYRKGHYSLRIGRVYKIFGMTRKDIRGYHDLRFFNYIKALRSRNKYLRDYYRNINPNLNYRLKLGDYSYIFLDTGEDSIADTHDLLSGSPSTKGVKDYQIKLLREYILRSREDKIVIVMHTPPISPSLGPFKQLSFRRKFRLKRKLEWSDFYENNLKKYTGSARLEKVLNLKYQTIMYNWKTLLKIFTGSDKIIQRKIDMIICGHTHTLKEFRLKEVKKKESEKINLGFFIAPIFIDVPCKVYTNKYRELFNAFKDPLELQAWFDVNKPFIFQTQAIGPISTKYKFKTPGFRYYTIKNNQIIKVDLYSLHLRDELTVEQRHSLQVLGLHKES